ncbi:hypothetical protein ONS95_013233 [Cadophora gregata]|uniref:uncharacterized protein n=1 Tax=Cadophora gregata TaxID=51156 RepID=UPI0026DC995D|nr:uncharacterized protein ONS95_013233 [Cadophora gregata]KAK0116204.1 hypothetical protein ONS95_013233 [Cadophora gregata]
MPEYSWLIIQEFRRQDRHILEQDEAYTPLRTLEETNRYIERRQQESMIPPTVCPRTPSPPNQTRPQTPSRSTTTGLGLASSFTHSPLSLRPSPRATPSRPIPAIALPVSDKRKGLESLSGSKRPPKSPFGQRHSLNQLEPPSYSLQSSTSFNIFSDNTDPFTIVAQTSPSAPSAAATEPLAVAEGEEDIYLQLQESDKAKFRALYTSRSSGFGGDLDAPNLKAKLDFPAMRRGLHAQDAKLREIWGTYEPMTTQELVMRFKDSLLASKTKKKEKPSKAKGPKEKQSRLGRPSSEKGKVSKSQRFLASEQKRTVTPASSVIGGTVQRRPSDIPQLYDGLMGPRVVHSVNTTGPSEIFATGLESLRESATIRYGAISDEHLVKLYRARSRLSDPELPRLGNQSRATREDTLYQQDSHLLSRWPQYRPPLSIGEVLALHAIAPADFWISPYQRFDDEEVASLYNSRRFLQHHLPRMFGTLSRKELLHRLVEQDRALAKVIEGYTPPFSHEEALKLPQHERDGHLKSDVYGKLSVRELQALRAHRKDLTNYLLPWNIRSRKALTEAFERQDVEMRAEDPTYEPVLLPTQVMSLPGPRADVVRDRLNSRRGTYAQVGRQALRALWAKRRHLTQSPAVPLSVSLFNVIKTLEEQDEVLLARDPSYVPELPLDSAPLKGRHARPAEFSAYKPKTDVYTSLSSDVLFLLCQSRSKLDNTTRIDIVNMSRTNNALIRYLEEQDENMRKVNPNYTPVLTTSRSGSCAGLLDKKSAQLICRLLVEDLARCLIAPTERRLLLSTIPDSRNLSRTWNGNLVAPSTTLQRLQDIIDYGALPTYTSSEDLLCGPRALSEALHTVRLRINAREGHEMPAEEITAEQMFALLFDEEGSPTIEYSRYVKERLAATGAVAGDNTYDIEMAAYMATSNLGIQQLAAVLELLAVRGDIGRRFSIGIVTAGHEIEYQGAVHQVPASAAVVGDDNLEVIWLYNDNAELSSEAEIGHWQGFGFIPDEDEADQAAALISNLGLSRQVRDDDIENSELRAYGQRDFRQPLVSTSYNRKISKRDCDRCRELRQDVPCKGYPCTNCVSSCVGCRRPEEQQHEASQAFNGAKLSVARLAQRVDATENSSGENDDVDDGGDDGDAPWTKPFYEWDEVDFRLAHDDPKRWLPEPEPEGKHYLVITVGRISSGGIGKLLRLLFGAPATAQKHERWLQRSNIPQWAHHLPDSQRPGGYNSVRRNFYLVMSRKGCLPIPTSANASNIASHPSLRALIDLLDNILRPNNPNIPLEINFLLRGFASFAVDAHMWGDYMPLSGLFDKFRAADQQNGTNILDRVYITLAVEPHTVDGVARWSLNFPHRTPGFHGFHGKLT